MSKQEPQWEKAKDREDVRRQVADAIKYRIVVHAPPEDHEFWTIEFNLCKGYTCGQIFYDTQYSWCQDCRDYYQNKK